MLSLLSALFFALAITAQSPQLVSGQVVSGTPPTPVAGARISVGPATATTDRDGRFSLNVPRPDSGGPGIRVNVTAAGYIDASIEVSAGAVPLTIVLQRTLRVSEDVEVTAEGPRIADPASAIEVSPAAVRSVAGSADNVFRVLQTLPGVSTTNDIESRLSVRGGGPDQNLTVMDGVEIHNPYRLFGLTSAFNPETIDSFELTAGGFGPQYGDRLSSILVVENRAGTTARSLAGSGALSITDANVVLEGRLPGRARGSWLLTGRRTYYDLVAERITDNDLPSFGDLQSKVVWALGGGREITLFGLRSRERTDATFTGNNPGDRFGLADASRNDLASLTFFTPVTATATSKTIVSWYRYADALDVDGSIRNEGSRSNMPGDEAFQRASIVFTRDVAARDIALRQQITAVVAPSHTIDAGIEAHALRTSWGWRIAGDRNTNEANGSSAFGGTGLPDVLDSSAPAARAGAWIEDAFSVGARTHLAAGVRVDWSGLASDTPVAPRMRATIDVSPRTRLKAAGGLYTQSPGYEKLLQADYFVDLTDAVNNALLNERSWHAVGGVEHDVSRAVRARVELYHKTFDRLLVGRLETPEETAARVSQYRFPPEIAASVPSAPGITTIPVNGATGRSYGIEFFLEKHGRAPSDRLSGWFSYSWGRATIQDYGREYPFDYDRRHSLSLVSTLKLTSRVDLGSTLRVASGFPETTPVGLRIAATRDEATGTLIPARDASGQFVWTIDYGDIPNLNGSRLPVYARLDLRMTFTPSAASRWQLYVEVLNALKRENAGQVTPELKYDPDSDRPALTSRRQQGLPLLPSFGLRMRF